MPATGDRITKRKDGLFQGMYTAQTPDGPKLDRYSHWMPSMGRNTAEGIDEALG